MTIGVEFFATIRRLGSRRLRNKQGVRPVDFAQRAAHRFEKIHAAFDLFCDQMGDDLAIRFRAKVGAAFGQTVLSVRGNFQ